MRNTFLSRLFCSAAVLALIAVSAPVSFAKGSVEPETAAVDTTFNSDNIDSFAGAFLAAFTADNDGDYDKAVDFYQAALAFEPDNLQLQERLMVNLFLAGKFKDGVLLAKELKSDPAVERVTSIALGLDAIRLGKFDRAIKDLAYEGPNDLDRLMSSLLIAWADFGKGNKKAAIATVDGLKGPEWFTIFRNYHAGIMSALAGKTDDARRYLTSAVTDPNGGASAQDVFIRSIFALATVELKAGNKQKALDAVAAGEALTGRYAPFEALRETIEDGKPIKPDVTNAVEGAAAVMFSVGSALHQSVAGNEVMRDSATEIVGFYLQSAAALSPKSADTKILLGNTADLAGKPERAIEYYKQVDATSPMFRVSELQLGLDLSQLGKNDEAEKHLKTLVADDPSDFRAYLALGSVYADMEDYAAMAATYDEAVKRIGPTPNRSQWGVFYQRGIAYERLKKWSEAEPNFRKALELFPDQPQVLNYLGYSWIDMNTNLDEGMAMIKKAVDQRPDDGYIVDSLGWAYYRIGNYEEAAKHLQRAVQLKESDATINDHYGDALWRVGRKLEATFQWNRALAAKPEKDLEAKIREKLKTGLPDLKGKTPAEADADKVLKAPATEAAGKKS